MNRPTHHVILALGSNLAAPLRQLRLAIEAIAEWVIVSHCSPVYETRPIGKTDQPNFFNMTIAATTTLAPQLLQQHLKQLECDMGRRPGVANGPRCIDIDIIFFDDLILQSETLTIPHPRCHLRDFVLQPMVAMGMDYHHPLLNKSVAQLLADVAEPTIIATQPLP